MRNLLGFVFMLAAAQPALAADVYATRLTAVAYDGAMRANVQGDGHVSASLDGKTLGKVK